MDNGDDELPSEQPAVGACECRSIEWYADGQARVVDVGGVRVVVRFVGRKGRRARIAIIAPPGAAFHAAEGYPSDGISDSNGPR